MVNKSFSITAACLLIVNGGCGSQDAALRNQSAKNLNEIGKALLSGYTDAHRGLPPYRIVHPWGEKGAPVDLSWRVSILPYMGHKALYSQFKLDEPWDSAHNKTLLKKMPAAFALLPEEKSEGLTRYRVPVGNGLCFTPQGTKGLHPVAIVDGSDFTIVVAEAAEAVPWTKPEELFFDLGAADKRRDLPRDELMKIWEKAFWKAPLPKLGGAYRNGFHVLTASGKVIHVRQDVDEHLLRLAIYANDRKPFDWKDLTEE